MVLDMEMTKTYQYRKVMKPMLERKRRARINKCLDELKDLMVECLTQEGEHITRLEKADILELTVEHMKKLKQRKMLMLGSGDQQQQVSVAESFRAGYIHAANEVSKALAAIPGVNIDLGTQLMSHLAHRLNYLQVVVPTTPLIAGSGAVPSSAVVGPPQQTHLSPFGFGRLVEDSGRMMAANYITPPPSECSSDRGTSPPPSESSSVWRPW